jgi:hypothetical protein
MCDMRYNREVFLHPEPSPFNNEVHEEKITKDRKQKKGAVHCCKSIISLQRFLVFRAALPAGI